MKYFPSKRNLKTMLTELGVNSIESLFADIPEEVRLTEFKIPEGISEMEIEKEIKKTLSQNRESLSFLGGGVYNHYVPAAVRAILSRSEFYTSYTPYQPEVSQGLLQALFEYQSFISELTGMPVANISLYDWSSAAAEALLMACRLNRKERKVVVSSILPKNKKNVIENYLKGAEIEIHYLDYEPETGFVDLEHLEKMLSSGGIAGVYVENPNYFGILDKNVLKIKEKIEELWPKALLIVGVNPLTLFAVKPPSTYGADMVVGEGQVFGNKMNYGGPLLGIFATKKDRRFIIQMPGRLIGMTKDAGGRKAYTMTLQSREQHIKREKATSNICSNQTLCALASCVYLALMGRIGMMEIAKKNMENAAHLKKGLSEIDGFSLPFKNSPIFNEFVVKVEHLTFKELEKKAKDKNILPGIGLEPHFPQLKNAFLVNTTELHTKRDLDYFLNFLRTQGA